MIDTAEQQSLEKQLDARLASGIACPYCETHMPCGEKTRGDILQTLSAEGGVFNKRVDCTNEGDESGAGACPSVETNEFFLLQVGRDAEGEIGLQTFTQDQVFAELQKARDQKNQELETIQTQARRKIAELMAAHQQRTQSIVKSAEESAKYRTAIIQRIRNVLGLSDPESGTILEEELKTVIAKLERMSRDAEQSEKRGEHVSALNREIKALRKILDDIFLTLNLEPPKNGRLTEDGTAPLFQELHRLMLIVQRLTEIQEKTGWNIESLIKSLENMAARYSAHPASAPDAEKAEKETCPSEEITQPHIPALTSSVARRISHIWKNFVVWVKKQQQRSSHPHEHNQEPVISDETVKPEEETTQMIQRVKKKPPSQSNTQ